MEAEMSNLIKKLQFVWCQYDEVSYSTPPRNDTINPKQIIKKTADIQIEKIREPDGWNQNILVE